MSTEMRVLIRKVDDGGEDEVVFVDIENGEIIKEHCFYDIDKDNTVYQTRIILKTKLAQQMNHFKLRYNALDKPFLIEKTVITESLDEVEETKDNGKSK